MIEPLLVSFEFQNSKFCMILWCSLKKKPPSLGQLWNLYSSVVHIRFIVSLDDFNVSHKILSDILLLLYGRSIDITYGQYIDILLDHNYYILTTAHVIQHSDCIIILQCQRKISNRLVTCAIIVSIESYKNNIIIVDRHRLSYTLYKRWSDLNAITSCFMDGRRANITSQSLFHTHHINI